MFFFRQTTYSRSILASSAALSSRSCLTAQQLVFLTPQSQNDILRSTTSQLVAPKYIQFSHEDSWVSWPVGSLHECAGPSWTCTPSHRRVDILDKGLNQGWLLCAYRKAWKYCEWCSNAPLSVHIPTWQSILFWALSRPTWIRPASFHASIKLVMNAGTASYPSSTTRLNNKNCSCALGFTKQPQTAKENKRAPELNTFLRINLSQNRL